jgi:hypothetical protein
VSVRETDIPSTGAGPSHDVGGAIDSALSRRHPAIPRLCAYSVDFQSNSKCKFALVVAARRVVLHGLVVLVVLCCPHTAGSAIASAQTTNFGPTVTERTLVPSLQVVVALRTPGPVPSALSWSSDGTKLATSYSRNSISFVSDGRRIPAPGDAEASEAFALIRRNVESRTIDHSFEGPNPAKKPQRSAAGLYAQVPPKEHITARQTTYFDFEYFESLPKKMIVAEAQKFVDLRFPPGSALESAIKEFTTAGAKCGRGEHKQMGAYYECDYTRSDRRFPGMFISIEWKIIITPDPDEHRISKIQVNRGLTSL